MTGERPYTLYCGDALAVLPTLESGSVDCVITDPPYPCIERSYGYWTEAEWFTLMRAVVPECMRVLKPTGSAVFILQPNSERVGRMRTWLWEFMLWVGKEWGIVQDAYWWNSCSLPVGGAITDDLLRSSVKTCAWIGSPACHKSQAAVRWSESQANAMRRASAKSGINVMPSGRSINSKKCRNAAIINEGTTPFNLLPFAASNGTNGGGKLGHAAGTPLPLCSWWTRYLCPPGGVVLDPFSGAATVGLAALKHGCRYVGIEKEEPYHAIAARRLAEAASLPLLDAAGV